MIGFAILLGISSAGFCAGFHACRVAYEDARDVPVAWAIPTVINAALVVVSTALLLGEIAP